jgi:hypothetical protein
MYITKVDISQSLAAIDSPLFSSNLTGVSAGKTSKTKIWRFITASFLVKQPGVQNGSI